MKSNIISAHNKQDELIDASNKTLTETKKQMHQVEHSSTQTEPVLPNAHEDTSNNHKIKENSITTEIAEKEQVEWNVNQDSDAGKSIADQVKEAAQSALQQSGMVYVESAGMYYDYKSGYYYNSVSSIIVQFN